MHKKPKYQDTLAAYTLGIAGCGAALGTAADLAVVDAGVFNHGSGTRLWTDGTEEWLTKPLPHL